MTRSELLKNMSKRTDVNVQTCGLVLDAFSDEVRDCLAHGDRLFLKDFISFEVVERPQRKGRNPQTGEIVTFPAVNLVKCNVGKKIKDAVREGDFEDEAFAF